MAQTFLLLENGVAINRDCIRYISWRIRRAEKGYLLEVFAKVDDDYAPILWSEPVEDVEKADERAREIIREIVGRVGLALDIGPLAKKEEKFKPFKPHLKENL